MKNSKLITNIGIIILVLICLGAGYYFFFGPSDDSTIGISPDQTTSNETTIVSENTSEFLILLDSIQTVDLGGKIFSNTIFASELQDFAIDIPSKPQGRSNPFAPIGTANLTISTNTSGQPANDQVSGTVNFFDSN